MYIHPNSLGYNAVEFFPEIFKEGGVDFEHYCTALAVSNYERPTDYFLSSDFLFGSLKSKDTSMLFSAVQRLNGYKHVDFQKYVSDKKVRDRLLDISDTKIMRQVLDEIKEEYNTKYGMRRIILKFYLENLNDEGKKTLISGISIPAYFYTNFSNDEKTAITQRIDFLLKIRNGQDHAAMYHPLAMNPPQPEYIVVKKGNKEYTFLVKLTFEEFHELTRQAMTNFWLKEYKSILSNGGKANIDKIVKDRRDELKKINDERKKAGLIK